MKKFKYWLGVFLLSILIIVLFGGMGYGYYLDGRLNEYIVALISAIIIAILLFLALDLIINNK